MLSNKSSQVISDQLKQSTSTKPDISYCCFDGLHLGSECRKEGFASLVR